MNWKNDRYLRKSIENGALVIIESFRRKTLQRNQDKFIKIVRLEDMEKVLRRRIRSETNRTFHMGNAIVYLRSVR